MKDYENELVDGMLPTEFCDEFEWDSDGELTYIGNGSSDFVFTEDIVAGGMGQAENMPNEELSDAIEGLTLSLNGQLKGGL